MHQAPMIDPAPPDANIRIDVDMWPIVLVTITESLREDDVDYLHVVCDQVFAASDRHVFLVDCTAVRQAPGPEVRKKLKRFEDSRQSVSAQKGIACAIVFESRVVRGAYTALRWISAQPVPNRAFGTVSEAARWCIDAIEREGLQVPPEAYLLAELPAQIA
ncbi:MAG: hypothetical protein AAF500_12955 [Myxococcota bacterium]